MNLRGFGRWCATPVRAVRSLFPFTQDGRQTLVYLVFAGAGPTLTLSVLWAMRALRDAGKWDWFGRMSFWVLGAALLIIVCGLGMFVSIRAVKLGKDGLDVGGWRDGDPPPPTVTTTTTTAVTPPDKP
jgi:hypothetical protein